MTDHRIRSDRNGEVALSRRQVECLSRLAVGLSVKQVAAELRISDHTAWHHIRTAMERLGAHNRAELIAQAVLHGFIPWRTGEPSR